MGLHLVTGVGEEEHITPNDDAGKHIGIFGADCVLMSGRLFENEQISSNVIRIYDGDGILQGRHFNIQKNDYIDIEIDNGIADLKRNDLIVFRYTRDIDTEIECIEPVVIKGVESANPIDPEYISGNIFDKDLIADFPVYRVKVEGLTISEIEPLFEIRSSLEQLKNYTDENINELTKKLEDFIENTNNLVITRSATSSAIDLDANTRKLATINAPTTPTGYTSLGLIYASADNNSCLAGRYISSQNSIVIANVSSAKVTGSTVTAKWLYIKKINA